MWLILLVEFIDLIDVFGFSVLIGWMYVIGGIDWCDWLDWSMWLIDVIDLIDRLDWLIWLIDVSRIEWVGCVWPVATGRWMQQQGPNGQIDG